MKTIQPFVLSMALCAPSIGQSILVPDSTVNTVAAMNPVDGVLQAAGFMNLNQGSLPTNRAYQVASVGSELWVSDDVLGRILRWDATGSVQVGSVDLAPLRSRGLVEGFGSVWVGAGRPSQNDPDFLVEISTTGTVLASHPMPGVVNSVLVVGSQLLVSINDFDDLIWVDPGSGLVVGTFHDSDGVGGIDSPSQLALTAGGNVLVAGGLSPAGIYEYDGSGNQVAYYDTDVTGQGGVRGVWPLGNGDMLFSAASGIYVYHVASGTVTLELETVVGYYFSERSNVLLGATECGPTVVNSTGRAGEIVATGQDVGGTTHFRLTAQNLPMAQSGYFLASPQAGFIANPGGSQGNLCLGGAIGRFNDSSEIRFTSNDSFFSLTVDTTAIPTPASTTAILAGETWRFQCWYRDLNPMPTSNFTQVVAVTFQ